MDHHCARKSKHNNGDGATSERVGKRKVRQSDRNHSHRHSKDAGNFNAVRIHHGSGDAREGGFLDAPAQRDDKQGVCAKEEARNHEPSNNDCGAVLVEIGQHVGRDVGSGVVEVTSNGDGEVAAVQDHNCEAVDLSHAPVRRIVELVESLSEDVMVGKNKTNHRRHVYEAREGEREESGRWRNAPRVLIVCLDEQLHDDGDDLNVASDGGNGGDRAEGGEGGDEGDWEQNDENTNDTDTTGEGTGEWKKLRKKIGQTADVGYTGDKKGDGKKYIRKCSP